MAAEISVYPSTITQKVIGLLVLYVELSLSQSTTSLPVIKSSTIYPSISGNYSTPTATLNANASSSSGSSNATNTVVVPSPSSSSFVVGQSLSSQNQQHLPQLSVEEIEHTFRSGASELKQKSPTEIDPKRVDPIDVNVIEILKKMIDAGEPLLRKCNKTDSNPTVNYFNVTDSLVIIMKKFNCIGERKAVIPDRSSKATRKDLGKVTDFVELKFNCSKIEINVNGYYSEWTTWSQCDKNYDVHRNRSCEGAQHGGQCYGPSTETRKCIDGYYSEWTTWSQCDRNYDVHRNRSCEGAQHGVRCYGPSTETRKCNCTFNETKGEITSPRFPRNYSTGVNCVWFLSAPVNHTVKLTLKEFQLEEDKKCFYDYMEFYNGKDITNKDNLIGNRLCGNHSGDIIKSSGQNLSVVFNSDKSETSKGFRAVWSTEEKEKEKVVSQYITTLTMIYSPNVNESHFPLGTATTCTSERAADKECIFNDKVYIISRLISTQMGCTLPLTGESRIVIKFAHIMHENLFPTIYNGIKYCVIWNNVAKKYTRREDNDLGAWTRRGCMLTSTNLTHTSCACDREGLFAVLGQEKIESSKLKLLANTYIGIGISYFILILAIVHIVWKIEIHGGEVMRINMCAAIIAMQTFFLIGAHVPAQQTLCGFLAFAIYFSVLAEFCWLLLHGLRIHGKIKKIFSSSLNIEIVYVVIGWGLPMLLAFLAIGVKIDPKHPDEVCWEAAAGSSMWGYAAPLVLISLFNGAILIKLLIPTQDVRDAYDHKELRFRVLKDFVFLFCFVLTCTFAYQAVEEERFFEQYLLSAFVIIQAVVMFVFGREGRKDFVKRVPEPKPEPEIAKEEPDENIYEIIDLETTSKEKNLSDGAAVRRSRKRATNKQAEKITVCTLKNLNIYKEGGQYVIEA
ncbi:adhesion G protein-coupled receptor B3-like isoform X2 [Montipora foliosa]|uniref:adhesion G protein-coupled receptor B3-like isoform X2 n=1 Tax=Montipora foliosa TaxID=591990 RepID=UPI0035F12B38